MESKQTLNITTEENDEKPPGKVRNTEESSLYPRLSVLHINRWGSLFIRSKGRQSEYTIIPAVSHLLHRQL